MEQEVRMVRTFLTHRVRRQTELSGRLWRFEALEGDRKGEDRKSTRLNSSHTLES